MAPPSRRRPPPEQEPFTAHCLELLEGIGRTRAIRMFGAIGVYVEGRFIALIEDDRLFLKAGAAQRAAFEAAGCQPFRYTKASGEVAVMSYWEVPNEALESPLAMRPWAELAWQAAQAAPARKPRKPSAR